MFGYYLQLSLRALKAQKLVYSLLILVLSLGVAMLLANLTILKTMSAIPLSDKSEKVFNVSMNSWPSKRGNQPQPFHLLRYRDTQYILDNKISKYAVVHYKTSVFTKNSESNSPKRIQANVRATTSDFFDLMRAPFAQGQGFSSSRGNEIVISDKLNQDLFKGESAIGKSLDIKGKLYQIVGVLDKWNLKPVFYHAAGGNAFKPKDDIYFPLETAIDNGWSNQGNTFSAERFNGISDTRNKNVFFLRAFVELHSKKDKFKFQQYMDNYTINLKQSGEHPRDINNRLLNIAQWLKHNQVIDQTMLAFAIATTLFLAVCIFNASSLLLSLNYANHFEISLRRAIGASMKSIIKQEMVRSLLLATIASVFAIAFASAFLAFCREQFSYLSEVAELDFVMILFGIVLTFLTAISSSIYPLIKTNNTITANQLK